MSQVIQKLQDKLNRCAFIIRKYHLGNKDYFVSTFDFLKETELKSAWHYAITKVSTNEIVKDSKADELENKKQLLDKLAIEKNDLGDIFFYLNSSFDPKKLKLFDEDIERRYRHLLAERFISLSKIELAKPIADDKPLKRNRHQIKQFLVIVGIIGVFFTPRIIKGLTSANVLANKIYEKSKYEYRIGAICNDGWKSSSTGRGTCSHHKGVREWVYKTSYRKTMEECLEEAKKVSWID